MFFFNIGKFTKFISKASTVLINPTKMTILKLVVVICSQLYFVNSRSVTLSLQSHPNLLPPSSPLLPLCTAPGHFIHSPIKYNKYLQSLVSIAKSSSLESKIDAYLRAPSSASTTLLEEVTNLTSTAAQATTSTSLGLSIYEASMALGSYEPFCAMIQSAFSNSHTFNNSSDLELVDVCGGNAPPFKMSLSSLSITALEKICPISSFDAMQSHHDQHLIPGEVPFNSPHQYNSSGDITPPPSPLVILRGVIGSLAFREAFEFLLASRLKFVARGGLFVPSIPPPPTVKRVKSVVGYGARLDIKNVEYKSWEEDPAATSRESSLENSASKQNNDKDNDNDNDNDKDNNFSLPTSPSLPTLSNLKHIYLQAASYINSSPDPLSTLQTLSQNLPSYASPLSALPLTPSIQTSARFNERSPFLSNWFGGGNTMVYVNGRQIDVGKSTFNMFELMDVIRQEEELIGEVKKLNLGQNQETKVLRAAINPSDFDANFDAAATTSTTTATTTTTATITRIDVGRGGKVSFILSPLPHSRLILIHYFTL